MRKIKKIQRRFKRSFGTKFHYFTFGSAIILSCISGYFSVYGLTHLFSAFKIPIMIMAISMEIGKVISVSALYNYIKRINYVLRTFLILVIICLMLITSLGMYSYLSNAFEITNSKLDYNLKNEEIKNDQLSNLNDLILNDTNQLKSLLDREKILNESRNKRNSELGIAYSNKYQFGINKTRESLSEISKELKFADESKKYIQNKLDKEIQNKISLQNEILALNGGNLKLDIGPIKYLSKTFKVNIHTLVNILIIILVLVCDPFAIAMFIFTNKIIKNNINDANEDKVCYNKKKKPGRKRRRKKRKNNASENE